MRTGAAVVVLILVLVATGCGSSGGGWQVVSQVQTKGSSPGFIDNAAVARGSQLELSVDAKPGIAVRAAYAFVCGDVVSSNSLTQNAGPANTPATVVLRTPPGPQDACRLNVLVNKSGPANMTVTLRMRPLSQ
jgi:hypothetical protein